MAVLIKQLTPSQPLFINIPFDIFLTPIPTPPPDSATLPILRGRIEVPSDGANRHRGGEPGTQLGIQDVGTTPGTKNWKPGAKKGGEAGEGGVSCLP